MQVFNEYFVCIYYPMYYPTFNLEDGYGCVMTHSFYFTT